MSATIIPFERPPIDGASPYEVVQISAGITADPGQYLVALGGPLKDYVVGRHPWEPLGWFEAAAEAIDVAAAASRRHGLLPIWDGAGIIAPERGPGIFSVEPDTHEPGDAA